MLKYYELLKIKIMYSSYKEIMNIASSIEKELNLPTGLLKKIYDTEKDVVYKGTRTDIFENLKSIILSSFEEYNKQNLRENEDK